jgi:hypothetical protein
MEAARPAGEWDIRGIVSRANANQQPDHTNPYRRSTFPNAKRGFCHIRLNKDVCPVGDSCV